MFGHDNEHSGKTFYKPFVFVIAVVLFAVLLCHGLKFGGVNPDPNLYQVVLLSNDQAFYGKLQNLHSQYPYLTDVYYLKNQQPDLDKDGKQVGGDKFTVIKRGIDEIHQPTDALYINAKNLMYWENVGPESLVAQGIKKDKEYRMQSSKSFQNQTLDMAPTTSNK